MSTAGFIPVNVIPAPPVPPPMTLYDACIHPPADETTLDGRPMADTATLADGTTAVRGYRWEGGFTWLPRRCPAISGRNECAPLASATYRSSDDSDKRYHMPVILVADNPCKSMMANDYDFERQATIDALIAGEPVAAEQELWDGTLARAAHAAGDTVYDHNLWLTKHGVATDLTPTPGTGVSPQRALQILEDFLSQTGTGGRGMIHVTSGIPAFFNYDLHASGQQLFSPRNTLIVPGAGYTGNGPATTDNGAPVEPDAGTVWAYATDQVTYRQGEVQVFPDNVGQALDRSTNDLTITAQRSVAATWDLCAVGAVLIALPA